MRKTLATLLLLCVLTAATAHATTVVAFKHADRIILAADSLVSTNDPRLSQPREYNCKIRRSGHWFFMAAGQYQFDDHEPDTFDLVAAAIAGTSTLPEALEAIVSGPGRRWPTRFQRLLARHPTTRPMLHVAIAGVDRSGRLDMGVFLLNPKQLAPLVMNIEARVVPMPKPGFVVNYLATVVVDALSLRLLNRAPQPAWLARGDAAAARRLIQLQAADTPDTVGGPIDVLEITGDGRAAWIGRDAASHCSAL